MGRLGALRAIWEAWRSKIALILAALALLFAAYSCDKARRAEARETEERAARQSAELDLAGWKRAATTHAPEKATPDIKIVEAAPPKIAWRTKTVAVPFSVPSDCGNDDGPESTTPGPEDGGAVTSAGTAPPLLVSADVQAALAPTATGQLHLSTVIHATLTRGEWSETQTLPTESVDFRVHPDVERAWADYQSRPPRFALGPRAPRHWRTGMFAGIGVSVGIDGRVAPAALVGVGLQL